MNLDDVAGIHGKVFNLWGVVRWFHSIPCIERHSELPRMRQTLRDLVESLRYEEESFDPFTTVHGRVCKLGWREGRNWHDAVRKVGEKLDGLVDRALAEGQPWRLVLIDLADCVDLDARLEDERHFALRAEPAPPPPPVVDDLAGFVAIGTLWHGAFESYKKARSFLKTHPEIRTERRGQRLLIDAAAWARAVAAKDRGAFDRLDQGSPRPLSSDDLAPEFIEGAAARLAEIRAKKGGK